MKSTELTAYDLQTVLMALNNRLKSLLGNYPANDKQEALIHRYSHLFDRLGGSYIADYEQDFKGD